MVLAFMIRSPFAGLWATPREVDVTPITYRRFLTG
jgi:hypothetical protein